MWSVFISADSPEMEALSANLWEAGTSGLLEEPDGFRAFFDDSADRMHICANFGVMLSTIREEQPFQASQLTPSECDPVFLGQRFYVAPSWNTEPPPDGRFRVSIDATSAFGSGRHESTRMCVDVLEKHLKPSDWVADIGCGSGILGAAAQLLGAGNVISCDIHQDSVRTARALMQTPIFVGSADGIRGQVADLLLANISRKVLDIIAADLKRITKPNGLIVIAGFLHGNPPKAFIPWEVWQEGDWECWVCRPQDIQASPTLDDPPPHSQQWWL